MNRILTTTGLLSASALFGVAGLTQAQPTTKPAANAPMSCCAGGQMMSMMAADASGARQVELNEAQQQAVDKLTKAYLSVRESLANDSADGVAEQFKAIDEAAHQLDASDNADLKAAAKKVAEAAHAEPESVDAAREAYKKLSEATIALVKLAPPSDDAAAELYVAHCPMAKASWLQTSKEIANPYMGQGMLKCGSVQSTLKGDAA